MGLGFSIFPGCRVYLSRMHSAGLQEVQDL